MVIKDTSECGSFPSSRQDDVAPPFELAVRLAILTEVKQFLREAGLA